MRIKHVKVNSLTSGWPSAALRFVPATDCATGVDSSLVLRQFNGVQWADFTAWLEDGVANGLADGVDVCCRAKNIYNVFSFAVSQ